MLVNNIDGAVTYNDSIPTTALINGEEQSILNAIPGDPGLSSEYTFNITFNLSAVTAESTSYFNLVLKDSTESGTIVIKCNVNRE